MSHSRKFTRAGFPKPNPNAEYKPDELVWVLLDPKMPYWPAQIKIGGTIHSMKKASSTKGQSKISIITFNDPSLSVHIDDDPPKKRKKDLSKKRVVPRTKLLEWEALKRNGEAIDFVDVLQELVVRRGLNSHDDMHTEIYKQWNDVALEEAEEEERRLHELKLLQAKRKQEREELERERQKEIRKANSLRGQKYDGRIYNKSTGKYEGWVLNAGDMIRYWAIGQINNENILIKTKIIELYDKYGTLRAKDTVPIVVEAGLNPPFWDTEIELLPTEDDMNPIYWPLSQCKFEPGEVENVLEKEHMKEVKKWDDTMRKSRWGGMMYNNNRNRNRNENNNEVIDLVSSDVEMLAVNENKIKKRRKRKRRLSDDDCDMNISSTSGSDIQILSNDCYGRNDMKNKNIINDEKSMKFTFVKPKKKKRKLNNPKKKLDVIEENKRKYINISGSDSSDDDMLLRDIPLDENENTNNKMSEDEYESNKNKNKRKNRKKKIENMSEDDYSNSNNSKRKSDGEDTMIDPIPFPASKPKRPRKPQPKQNTNKKKRNKRMKQTKIIGSIAGLPKPNEKKTKRKLRPNRDSNNDIEINGTPSPAPKKREEVSVNYVNDFCCAMFGSSNGMRHDDLCPDRYCNDNSNVFMSCNGGFYDCNNKPNSLNVTQITINTKENGKKSKGKDMSNKKVTTSKKKKKSKQKMSDQLDKELDTPKNNKNRNKNKKKKCKKGKMSVIPKRKKSERISSRKAKRKTGSSLLDQLIDNDTKCERIDYNNYENEKSENETYENEEVTEKVLDIGIGEDATKDLMSLLAFGEKMG